MLYAHGKFISKTSYSKKILMQAQKVLIKSFWGKKDFTQNALLSLIT